MDKTNKYIFKKENTIIGVLNIILLFGLVYVISFSLIEKYFLSFLITVFTCFIFFIILNKKWFNQIYFLESNIFIKFPYKIIGERFKQLEYNEIDKIIYYDYFPGTPSHCKINLKNKDVFRFNINHKDMVKLFSFLDSKEVKCEQFNQVKNEYR